MVYLGHRLLLLLMNKGHMATHHNHRKAKHLLHLLDAPEWSSHKDYAASQATCIINIERRHISKENKTNLINCLPKGFSSHGIHTDLGQMMNQYF
jgi:hypothetical protein